MRVAADVPVVTLVASVLVLLVCTALLSHTVPRLRWPRRRKRRSERRRATERLVVTGRLPALPAGPLPAPVTPAGAVRPAAPGRQGGPPADVPRPVGGPAEAEAFIEHLLETDPERVARLMMDWIREDGPPTGARS